MAILGFVCFFGGRVEGGVEGGVEGEAELRGELRGRLRVRWEVGRVGVTELGWKR